ncbi:RNA-directed DNA polymerase [Croceicoccus sp. F390]|uniref:RNA-directed DNA polymerase n=1 Tax=Croceicoccus esteveae TaxID=3075597 RepID=A0ABU2ZJV4_9SPHN|nr:RNA-directed DNA polymerase [Croceicoccus sp. F390]MDT0576501.1 RNA-directed DNA polymerase [Croceicoccus sp. F390]
MDRASRLKSLLGRAYFPKELPRVFTTTDFADHADQIVEEWKAAKLVSVKAASKIPATGAKKSGSYSYNLKAWADPEIISTPKKGYERRNLHITHPIPQALLAQEIASNWGTITKWLSRNRFSIDRVEISSDQKRGIKPLNFEAHRAKKEYIAAQSDWVVRTDITRFYPSIYTHSLSWAAYGKEKVKGNRSLYDGALADRLDQLVRFCNRGQTVGIPIGPETSRILADILSSRIDCEFEEKFSEVSSAQIDRLQDDWFVGATDLNQAERALSAISQTYRGYGLDINGSKTAVERIISPFQEVWKEELASFLSHTSRLTGARLREFLQLSLRLQLDSPYAPVISYALSVIEGRSIKTQDLETVETFLIRSASVSPGALNRICALLINLQHDYKRISMARIRLRFTELACRHIQNGNHYEVVWLLFTLRGLKISLNSKFLCEAAETVNSSAIILILLDMADKGLVWNKLPTANWEAQISQQGTIGNWSWLYAYEAIRKGWLKDTSNVLTSPFFAAMDKRDVVFYDPNKNVNPRKQAVAARRRQSNSNKRESLMLLSFLRGFDFGDYD